MLIAVISTLISSIALVGVAISLFLQARQLRANQIQAASISQMELMRLGLDNPVMIAELIGMSDAEEFAKGVALNWYMQHLSMRYAVNTISPSLLANLAAELFAVGSSRQWWVTARSSYSDASSRREKRFFAIVDGQFQQTVHGAESTHGSNIPASSPADSSSSAD